MIVGGNPFNYKDTNYRFQISKFQISNKFNLESDLDFLESFLHVNVVHKLIVSATHIFFVGTLMKRSFYGVIVS